MNLFRTKRAEPAPRARRRSRGQVIVIFAGAMLAFMGLMAIVIDVSWYWANTLRVQRAADAAALAGVVWLPNNFNGTAPNAQTTALAEALKNGYEPGPGTTIAMSQDLNNDRRLIVTVSASVPSFFARVIGIGSFPISRTSKAEFILPVAMGSPEAWYGVFGDIRDYTFTGPQTTTTALFAPTAATATTECTPTACSWTSTTTLNNKTTANGTTFSSSATTNLSQQGWGQYSFGIPGGATINGIEVQLNAKLGGSGTVPTPSTCTLGVQLSPDGGTTWFPNNTTTVQTAGLTTSEGLYSFGSAGSTAPWNVPAHTWVPGDFATGSTTTGFMTRLTWNRGGCQNTRLAMVDTLNVRVTYTATVTSAPTNKPLKGPGANCVNGLSDCFQPTGAALTYRGFWGTMNTEGAANVNGDAYQPYYDTNTSTVAPACPVPARACYDPLNYYNYAIEMPPLSTNGYVYVFDPTFCATAVASGTGDRWFGGTNPISSWYELYNTNNTPYNLADDGLVVPRTYKFADIAASDSTMGGSGGSECRQTNTVYGDGRDYHNEWFLVNAGAPLSGGPDGTVYRLHTTSTDLLNASAQRNANGEQSFAIYASDTGTAPKVYGLGAMQMFTPLELPAVNTFSEFYLAQVPQAHAGKTLEISLWDPGDTRTLAANIQIEIPTAGGWAATPMTWTAAKGTTNASAQNCNQNTSGLSIPTNVGGNPPNGTTGIFNGCWLTIDVSIPSTYTAQQQGWWKIKYNMSGTGVSNDVTTWTAKIRGNPVHLVLP